MSDYQDNSSDNRLSAIINRLIPSESEYNLVMFEMTIVCFIREALGNGHDIIIDLEGSSDSNRVKLKGNTKICARVGDLDGNGNDVYLIAVENNNYTVNVTSEVISVTDVSTGSVIGKKTKPIILH